MNIFIKEHINIWEEFGDNRRNDTTYLSDIQFDEHFKISQLDDFIATVFEYLEGEYGLPSNVQYDKFEISKYPIYINYNTLEMTLLDSGNCESVELLNKHKLTIFNSSYLITTSEYLKPIYVLLFSTFKTIEGISYICNNLISVISFILPAFVDLKSTTCDYLSLPFSISFINLLTHSFKVSKFYSQIDQQLYTLCQKEK